MKLELDQQIFEKKYSNIKFNENDSVGGELFHLDRRTDGKDEALRNFLKAPKMWKQALVA